MSVRLFVGNLSFEVDSRELREEFASVGVVERAEIVLDRFVKRSRGFGFVEMADEIGARAAMQILDGRDLKGRKIRVESAISTGPGPGRGQSNRASAGPAQS